MTVQHPIFGVGPGAFSAVARAERIRNGEHGGEELVSHNTYTQTSSETGFPGIILFVGTVIMAIRYSYTDFRRLQSKDPELASCARYIFTATAGLASGIFFLSVGYSHLLGTIFALSLALHRVADSLDWSLPFSAVVNGRSSIRNSFRAPRPNWSRPRQTAVPGVRPASLPQLPRKTLPPLPLGARGHRG